MSHSFLLFPAVIAAAAIISVASGETIKGNFDLNSNVIGGRPITSVQLMLADYGPKQAAVRNLHANWNVPLFSPNIVKQAAPALHSSGAVVPIYFYSVDFDKNKEYHIGMVIENDQNQKQFYRFFTTDPTASKIDKPFTVPDFKELAKLDLKGFLLDPNGDRIKFEITHVHASGSNLLNKVQTVLAIADKLTVKLAFCDPNSPTHMGPIHAFNPVPDNTEIKILFGSLDIPPNQPLNQPIEPIECVMQKLPKHLANNPDPAHFSCAINTLIPSQRHAVGISVKGKKYKFMKQAAAAVPQQWEIDNLIDITNLNFLCHQVKDTCAVELIAISGTRTFDIDAILY